jgi:hypothetical protein
MFQLTNGVGDVVEFRVSFWQCVKAGAGAVIGSALVAVFVFPIGMVMFFVFYGTVGALFHAR